MGLKKDKLLKYLPAALFAAVCTVLFFIPRPAYDLPASEKYSCLWEDGTVTEENYFSAFRAYSGIAEDGSIALYDGENQGHIATSEDFLLTKGVLDGDDLLALLRLSTGSMNRLERAVLVAEYADDVYYSDGAFRFTGYKVAPAEDKAAKRVVLLHGTLPKYYLRTVGATELALKSGAELTAEALVGSSVSSVTAELPYIAEGSAIYREFPPGRRLVAVLAGQKSVSLASCAYIDDGALLACTKLEEITLPFIGNSPNGVGHTALFALFLTEEGYEIPETLKRVCVCGGMLAADAFFGCEDVEEIDACGVDPAQISDAAFLGAKHLTLLHTPRRDVILPAGGFDATVAPCGCTVYTRR